MQYTQCGMTGFSRRHALVASADDLWAIRATLVRKIGEQRRERAKEIERNERRPGGTEDVTWSSHTHTDTHTRTTDPDSEIYVGAVSGEYRACWPHTTVSFSPYKLIFTTPTVHYAHIHVHVHDHVRISVSPASPLGTKYESIMTSRS